MNQPKSEATSPELDAVVAALRGQERFLVVTHENPDGDALGSMLGATLALRALGKDALMHLAGEVALPAEYGFLPLGEVLREPPADLETRVLFALDCANERRLGPDPAILERAALVVNVDHHHDNSRFGALNLVVADASSTAEIVGDLLPALGVELDPAIAEALYVGLVTDTGRFQYANTTPRALRLAATLEEAGADLNEIFRHVYETVDFPKLKLLARALEHAELHEDGRLLVSSLARSDFDAAGAAEPYSEGIIDVLRQARGTEVVALVREPPPQNGGPGRRISLRSSSEAFDVSAMARARGGGGHRQAAGFSSDEPLEQIIAFIVEAFAAQDGGEAAAAATSA